MTRSDDAVPPLATYAVAAAKLTGYLLDPAHPDGSSKARFLLAFGFSPESPEVLAQALLDHARADNLVGIVRVRWGRRFVFEGPIRAPDGRRPRVRTVWQLPDGLDIVSLITAVPLTGDNTPT